MCLLVVTRQFYEKKFQEMLTHAQTVCTRLSFPPMRAWVCGYCICIHHTHSINTKLLVYRCMQREIEM